MAQWKKTEAGRISFTEAVLILISIAFGVSYISVLSSFNGNSLMFYMLLYNFIFGVVSCYMLTQAKRAHFNKLGSYHEIVYYYV